MKRAAASGENSRLNAGWRPSYIAALMLFLSMLSDNHLLYLLGVMPGLENAICMPHSHLPATKLIHYALFICLPIHTCMRTHKTMSWLPFELPECMRL